MAKKSPTPADDNDDRTSALRRIVERNLCKASAAYFITTYLKVFEARSEFGGPCYKDFTLWPRQLQYLEALERNYKNNDGMTVEKSRDVGATWLTLAWIFWHWVFTPDFTALVGSRTKAEVQKSGSINPLLSRLNAFYDQLPDWLKPEGFDPKVDSMALILSNPANGAVIMGESCNEKFGRSNRTSVVFLDEYAFWPFDVSDHVKHVSPCVVKVSSVNGRNHFWKNAMADKKKDFDRGTPIGSGCHFIFDWQDALIHTQEWYDKLKRESDPVVFAQEVDRDYESSVRGVIYPGIRDCPKGYYHYNPDWPLYLCWDFGISDDTVILFIQRNPEDGALYLIDEIARSGEDITWFVPFVPGKVVVQNDFIYSEYQQHRIDVHQTWRGDVAHYGDPTGDQRGSATGKSVFHVLKEYNIYMHTNTARWQNMQTRTQMTRKLIKRLHIDWRCKYFWDSMIQYHIPERNPGSQSTSTPNRGVHAFSHAPAALEAFAIDEPIMMYDTDKEAAIWMPNPWSFRRVS